MEKRSPAEQSSNNDSDPYLRYTQSNPLCLSLIVKCSQTKACKHRPEFLSEHRRCHPCVSRSLMAILMAILGLASRTLLSFNGWKLSLTISYTKLCSG